MNEVRYTLDCWLSPGCGWSRVGFDENELKARWLVHAEEEHDEDDLPAPQV